MRQLYVILLTLLCFPCVIYPALSAPDAAAEAKFPYSNEERDLFFYQCALPDEPRLKSMTFMFVGDKTISTIIVQDNDFLSAAARIEYRGRQWVGVDEMPRGASDMLKKDVYKISFKLITAKQYRKLFRTTPTEKCR